LVGGASPYRLEVLHEYCIYSNDQGCKSDSLGYRLLSVSVPYIVIMERVAPSLEQPRSSINVVPTLLPFPNFGEKHFLKVKSSNVRFWHKADVQKNYPPSEVVSHL
jgi:hypothetical protein